MSDLVERLQIAVDDDHERGCQMRFAMCTCGFDDKCAGAARDAIAALAAKDAEIARLKALLDEARDAMDDIIMSHGEARKRIAGTFLAKLEGDNGQQ